MTIEDKGTYHADNFPESFIKTRRTKMASTDRDCRQPANHPTHMCALLKKGLMMEIDLRSANPTVACARCGARADVPASVCQPKPL
jgi:hypothetical protein